MNGFKVVSISSRTNKPNSVQSVQGVGHEQGGTTHVRYYNKMMMVDKALKGLGFKVVNQKEQKRLANGNH